MLSTQTNFDHLKFAAQEWVTLTERQWRTFAGIFEARTLEAGGHLHYPGDSAHKLIFVSRGLLRFYYPAEDGKESNKAFLTEGAFGGALAAASLGLPLIYGVEALEETSLLAADLADLSALYDEHPIFDRFGRKLAEHILMRKEVRVRRLLQQSAKERYLALRQAQPTLVKRVAQYHLASYLGVTEASLSRLKRELTEAHYA